MDRIFQDLLWVMHRLELQRKCDEVSLLPNVETYLKYGGNGVFGFFPLYIGNKEIVFRPQDP